MSILEPARSFASPDSKYLDEIERRIAVTAAERDQIFRLRYRAYLRENAIIPNNTGRFTDDYDGMDNCRIFGLWNEGALLSTIRLHLLSRAHPYGPALDVFPDIVRPMIERGALLIDPTRLVVDREAAHRFPLLPHLTVRIACMACEHYTADYCLATVRAEHTAFYRRFLSLDQVSEPRPYPTLTKPICLMFGETAAIRDRIAARFPIFTSTPLERELLFELPALSSLLPQPADAPAASLRHDDVSDQPGASAGESKALN